MGNTARVGLAALGSIAMTACASYTQFHPTTPAEVAAGSPLGPSYALMPLPNDDDALLGRVLLEVPENGRSLDEVSRPNDCAAKLSPKKEGPLASTFEDGQELAGGGRARAALGAFGFEGDAQTATHFYYKLEVSKRVSQSDTTEYVACCKEKGSCGYGFVSALVYGDGEYATAAESSGSGSVTIPVAGAAGGFVKASVLHKRKVHGFVAALVTVTDAKAAKAITVLGDPAAAGITLDEQSLPDQVRQRFDAQKIVVEPTQGGPVETAYQVRDGNGPITENEFVRRYRALAGSSELDGAEQPRTSVALPILLQVASLAVVGAGIGMFVVAAQPKADDKVAPGATLILAAGVAGLAGGSILLAEAISKRDGRPMEHSINKFDAELYVARYNRLLLRKTVKDTQTRMRDLSASLRPVFSVGFVGVAGTF